MVIVEKRRRAAAGREAFVWDLRIAQSVWSAPALAALSGGRRGWNGGCSPCGQKAVLKSPHSRRSASSGDDQISRSVVECASPWRFGDGRMPKAKRGQRISFFNFLHQQHLEKRNQSIFSTIKYLRDSRLGTNSSPNCSSTALLNASASVSAAFLCH